jgi:hypothetical protein
VLDTNDGDVQLVLPQRASDSKRKALIFEFLFKLYVLASSLAKAFAIVALCCGYKRPPSRTARARHVSNSSTRWSYVALRASIVSRVRSKSLDNIASWVGELLATN